jgi:hypothetical protein
MWSGYGERWEWLGNKLLHGSLWLIHSGYGEIINVAYSLAPVFAFAGLLIGIPVLLILGICLLRQGVEVRRGMLLVGLGAFLSVTAMLGPVLLYSFWAREFARLEAKGDRSLSSLRKSLDRPNLNLKQRAFGWKAYASGIYLRDGEQILIPTETGEEVAYSPTETDKSIRKQMLETKGKLNHGIYSVPIWGCYSALWVLAGLLARIRPEA